MEIEEDGTTVLTQLSPSMQSRIPLVNIASTVNQAAIQVGPTQLLFGRTELKNDFMTRVAGLGKRIHYTGNIGAGDSSTNFFDGRYYYTASDDLDSIGW